MRSLDDVRTLSQFVHNLREGVYITNAQGRYSTRTPRSSRCSAWPRSPSCRATPPPACSPIPDGGRRSWGILRAEGAVREYELEILRPDGHTRTVLDTAYQALDEATGETLYHGILVDITDRKMLERQLRELAVRDPLTGCHNRRYMQDVIGRLEEASAPLGVVVIDIDHFKKYNDRHGHDLGDRLLVQFARFLYHRVRADDPVIRTGGRRVRHPPPRIGWRRHPGGRRSAHGGRSRLGPGVVHDRLGRPGGPGTGRGDPAAGGPAAHANSRRGAAAATGFPAGPLVAGRHAVLARLGGAGVDAGDGVAADRLVAAEPAGSDVRPGGGRGAVSSRRTSGGTPLSRWSTPPSVMTVPVGSDEPSWWKRGASPASCRFMPKSIRLTTICTWPCGCMSPPMTPNASQGLPSLGHERRDDGVERPLARRAAVGVAGVEGEQAAAVLEAEAEVAGPRSPSRSRV